MGSRLLHVYDIKFKRNLKWLFKRPATEMCIDLEQFSWYSTIKPGMGFLNHAACRAISELTGCIAMSCKAALIKKTDETI